MRKIILFLAALTGIVSGAVWAAHRQATPANSPIITIKNRADAPVKITGADISDDSYHATLQFDNSGVWNAYCVRWTFNGNSKDIFEQSKDRGAVNQTFGVNEVVVTGTHGKLLSRHKDGSPNPPKSAEVELVLVVGYDGRTWGDALDKDGKPTGPYQRILDARKDQQ